MGEVGLTGYLLLAAWLFACGVLSVTVKRNAIGILMGVELILNAANVNFVAIARYGGASVPGDVFVVFTVVLAAAEAAVALAIILGIYRNFGTTDVDRTSTLSG